MILVKMVLQIRICKKLKRGYGFLKLVLILKLHDYDSFLAARVNVQKIPPKEAFVVGGFRSHKLPPKNALL